MTIHAFATLDLRAPGAKNAQINHFAIIDAREIADSPYLSFHDWFTLHPVTEETANMPLTTDEERDEARRAMSSELTPPVRVGRIERYIGKLTVSFHGTKTADDRFTYAEPLRLIVSPYNYGDLTDAARDIFIEAVTGYVTARMDELPNPTHTDEEAQAEILRGAAAVARHAVYTARRDLLSRLGAQTHKSNVRVQEMLRTPEFRAAVITEMVAEFKAMMAAETF